MWIGAAWKHSERLRCYFNCKCVRCQRLWWLYADAQTNRCLKVKGCILFVQGKAHTALWYEVADVVHVGGNMDVRKTSHTGSTPMWLHLFVHVERAWELIAHPRAACVESYILRSGPDRDQKAGSAELISSWLFHIPFHPPPPTTSLPPSRRPAPLLWSEDRGHGNSRGRFDHSVLFVFVSTISGGRWAARLDRRQTGVTVPWVWLMFQLHHFKKKRALATIQEMIHFPEVFSVSFLATAEKFKRMCGYQITRYRK